MDVVDTAAFVSGALARFTVELYAEMRPVITSSPCCGSSTATAMTGNGHSSSSTATYTGSATEPSTRGSTWQTRG